MVNQSILRCVVFCFEGTEKGLLSTENLYGTSRMLSQIDQATGVAYQSRADELADKCSQIWCNGGHAVAEVVGELCAVC